MKRLGLLGILVAGCLWGLAWAWPSPDTGAAQTQGDDATEIAISDLQTRVAGLETRVAAQSSDALPPAGEGDEPDVPAARVATPASDGQSARFGEWDVTLTGVETSEGFDGIFDRHDPRGIFLVVSFTAASAGNTPAPFPYNELTLTDSQGRTFSLDWDGSSSWLIQNTDLSLSDELQPGLPYDLVGIFDVPADASALVLGAEEDQAFAIDLDR